MGLGRASPASKAGPTAMLRPRLRRVLRLGRAAVLAVPRSLRSAGSAQRRSRDTGRPWPRVARQPASEPNPRLGRDAARGFSSSFRVAGTTQRPRPARRARASGAARPRMDCRIEPGGRACADRSAMRRGAGTDPEQLYGLTPAEASLATPCCPVKVCRRPPLGSRSALIRRRRIVNGFSQKPRPAIRVG